MIMRFKYKGRRYKMYPLRLISLIALIAVGMAILFIGKEKTYSTPYGSYSCKGGLLKVCSTDSVEVFNQYGR